MNKLLHLFVVISLILLSCLEMNAQTSLLYTDFSNGIPSSWGQSPNNPTYSWGSANNGVGSLTPYYGSSYALLSSDVIQSPVKLVTPMLTISAVENPVLSFWFAQPESSTNVFDNLKIYYRTSYTSSWSLLIHEDEVKNYWQYREIGIDELSTFNIQFAFEYNYNQGIGIAIDKIYVGSQSLCTTPTNLRVPSITSSTANLTWAASYEAESFKLKVSTAPILDMMQTSDVLDVIVYNSPYLVTGLNASEYYYFYVKSICDSDESDWSEQGTFRTACNAFSLPLVENFEACNTVSSIFNTCWTKYAGPINCSSNRPTSSLTPQCNDCSLIMSCYYFPNLETNDASLSRDIVTHKQIDTPDSFTTQISFQE